MINQILALALTLLLWPGISVLVWSGLVIVNSYLCRTFGFDEESWTTATVFMSSLVGSILTVLFLIYRGFLALQLWG